MSDEALLIIASGADHPGITARLTGVLAGVGAQLLDIEQVVVQGQLALALCVKPGAAPLREALAEAASQLGVKLEVRPLDAATPARDGLRYVVTALGPTLGAPELHALATTLADHGANIERIQRLSEGRLSSLEVHVSLPEASEERLKRALLELAMRSELDLALQREGLFRRSKRLVVMDMDSTLIQIEVINELARAKGVVEQVAAITERAMQGEMDYDASLRQRLALLAGLDVAVLERIAAELPLTDGAETLVRVLKRLGYKTAVISGGFSHAAEALRERLGIDYAYSNVLEVVEGKLTGRVIGPIVNAERKASLLETLARAENVLLEQVIAVGDGANDLLMLERAGLGIAFRAKPKLREAADTSLTRTGLDGILHLLGLSARDSKRRRAR